jgi:hypothetical protein
MGCKLVEKVLEICSGIWCWEKKNFKKTDLKIRFFYASLLGNGLNKFQFGIVQPTTSKKDDL